MEYQINIEPVDYSKIAYIMSQNPDSEIQIRVSFPIGWKNIVINMCNPYYTISGDDDLYTFNYNHNSSNELRRQLEDQIRQFKNIKNISCKCV